MLLNVTPDHLDRHGTMEAYAGLKARLVAGARHPIVGDDDDWCRDISERLRLANRSWVDLISARTRVRHGWYATGSTLVSNAPWTGPLGVFADLAGIGSLRGQHNIQNALAASAAALSLGVPAAEVAAALRRSPACRIAWRRSAGSGARSSSTTARPPTPTAPPPRSPPSTRDVFWILGGRPKEGGITSLDVRSSRASPRPT